MPYGEERPLGWLREALWGDSSVFVHERCPFRFFYQILIRTIFRFPLRISISPH